MKEPTPLQRSIFEDIYDYVKECSLSKNQKDWYAMLSREFAVTARRNLHNFLKDKNIEWNGDTNEITIGEHFIIKLIIK